MKPNRRWNLCPVALLVLLLTCLGVSAQVSYWFQGWQRSGNAADAQAYFMLPGQGVNFTYGNNRVFINANGVLFATNALWATNWVGSNSMQAQITGLTNAFQTNAWHLNGNALGSTVPFLGSTDNQPLQMRVNSSQVGLFDVNDDVVIGRGASAGGGQGMACGFGSTAAGLASFASPYGTAKGVLGIALGPSIANSDGSFVANDTFAAVTDDGPNQFAAGYAGGFKLISSGAGVSTDGPVNSTNTINAYNATGNSFTYDAQNNAGVAAVQSPLGNWGFLSLTNSQLINIAVSSTYYPITNFNYAATNRFGASYVRGELTNTLDGWYRIAFNVSIAAPTANDAVDADLLINGVVTEIIASHSTAPGGVPPKYVTLSASGIQHLSAGTRVGIGITDTTGTGNATILHSQLTIGSP